MKANELKLAYVGKQPGSRDSDSWFTPAEYVEKARRVLGRIDLDPFSSEEANRVVGARRIFSESDSAFNRRWADIGQITVFMNPPYGRGIIDRAVGQFMSVYYDGQISRAVVLVNNATDTQWAQCLLESCVGLCLVSRRIAFYNADGKHVSSNTRGQMFLYFDTRGYGLFKEVFATVGEVFLR